MAKSSAIVLLAEMINNQEGIVFALLSGKTAGVTKDGKPFFRVSFRDDRREATAFVWSDSALYPTCAEIWRVGGFYKISAVYKETDYGPQLIVRRSREAVESDAADGFSPSRCRPTSAIEPSVLMDELLSLAKTRLGKGPLLILIQKIFRDCRDLLLEAASSRDHHHAFYGGMLEHALSVTKITAALCDHFQASYPNPKDSFSPQLAVAGAILHEVGKIFEMESGAISPKHSLSGELIGYPVLGRDLIIRFASAAGVDDATRLRLEHIVLTHPRFADWGAVGTPRSLEALIVHSADYADSLFASANKILSSDHSEEPFTLSKGPLGASLLK